MKKEKANPEADERSPFEKFKVLAKKVVSVPKSAVKSAVKKKPKKEAVEKGRQKKVD